MAHNAAGAFGVPAGPVEAAPVGFRPGDEQGAILRDILHAAGVELGAYDERIVRWFAEFADWSTFAVMVSWVARAAQREPVPGVALPSRFDAPPAEVDQHLRRILAEDTYLRYQQCIGGHAVREAAKDLRMEAAEAQAHGHLAAATTTVEAANYIDPFKGGGPYPFQLLCSQHNGFGPCPGAPACTPREDDGRPR
ncbi:hypothetical protein ACFY1J_31050 [Streptomyces sp. NPDC001406]|uniref:hypothetical protein n=1 Tax=Streptomyces sp. NPDC001406 TaxID=3364572 RepID=UPI003698EA57